MSLMMLLLGNQFARFDAILNCSVNKRDGKTKELAKNFARGKHESKKTRDKR